MDTIDKLEEEVQMKKDRLLEIKEMVEEKEEDWM